MKKDLHPPFVDCKVTCACGHSFMTKATVPEINTELCSKCHPFFTGEQILIDTAGQVERFNKKVAVASAHSQNKAKKQPKKLAKAEAEEEKEETTEELLTKLKSKLQKEAAQKEATKSKKAKPAPKEA